MYFKLRLHTVAFFKTMIQNYKLHEMKCYFTAHCPALISDESAGLSDADCLSVCVSVCLSVCLQLYAFGNRKADRSEILGHDLVVLEWVQYQISSKSDHRRGVFTPQRSGLKTFQPFPHSPYAPWCTPYAP